MLSPSNKIFESLVSWERLQELIANGETEGLYYECKAPGEPRFTKEMRLHLAKACSAFGNANGGVVIYGMSTTRHAHSGLDVMTQLEPIANILNFQRQVENDIFTLTTPVIHNAEFRVLKERETDTRGVLIVHIPHRPGDPVQSNFDALFYFRSGDDCTVAPYDMIRRFFAAAASPDIIVTHDQRIYEKSEDGTIVVPIGLQNNSSAIGEHVKVVVRAGDADTLEFLTADAEDVTKINPGSGKVFIASLSQVLHKGLNIIVTSIRLKPKPGAAFPIVVRMGIDVLANHMEMKHGTFVLSIAEGGLAEGTVTMDDGGNA